MLAQIPDTLVVGHEATAKAWQVRTTTDGAFWLASITVVESLGTAGMDWAIGTSGDDTIATGPESDLIQLSGGYDTVDAGSGSDSLVLTVGSMMVSKLLDDTGVLHLGVYEYESGSMLSAQSSFHDWYRVAKLSDEAIRVEKMAEDGVSVESTMLLSHVELISFGMQNIPLTISSLDGSFISGTPWDDLIALDVTSISNLQNLWGDTGADVLAFDLGAGYSDLHISRISGQLHLVGSVEPGGALLDLAVFNGYASGYDGSLAFAVGPARQTIWSNEIESFRFTSGLLTFDVDISRLALVTFEGGESLNTITGTTSAELIDADALCLAYGATTAQDSIIANGGDDTIAAGAGNDTVISGSGNESVNGGIGNDFIFGYGGSDLLDGGSGSDTLYGGDGDDSVTGGSDNDTMYGDGGDDTLAGGTGNDYLQGNLGNDLYLFNRGDGSETINDYDSVSGETDTLEFGPDIAPSEVTANRVGTDLMLAVQGTPDTIRVSSWFSDTGVYVLDRVVFSDGTEWNEEIIRQRAEGATVDDEPPVIEALELPADRLYSTDDSLLFFVRFSEAVTITESTISPAIALMIGDESVNATLFFGSGSDTLLFRYVLSTGDFDPDGISVGSEIVLNGAIIRDLSGNALADRFFEVGDTTGIRVDYAPVLHEELIDQVAALSQPFSLMIPETTFVDYDAADRLAYSATRADGSALPAWLSFNPDTCTFSGTPENGDAVTITVTVTATDTAGASASDVFTITVQENSHNLGLNIIFWNGGEGIEGVTALLTADGASNTIIAADNNDGHYGYTGLNEGNYQLRADRAVSGDDGAAVGFTDALAALKIALGMRLSRDGQAVSSYQYLAADVNRNGQVEAGDAFDILEMALNRDASPAEWAFVPSTTGEEPMSSDHVTWPDAEMPVTLDQNREIVLVGVLPGDVDGSWGGGRGVRC